MSDRNQKSRIEAHERDRRRLRREIEEIRREIREIRFAREIKEIELRLTEEIHDYDLKIAWTILIFILSHIYIATFLLLLLPICQKFQI